MGNGNGAGHSTRGALIPLQELERFALLTKLQVRIYIVLRAHANKHTMGAWPSLRTIAEEAHCTRRSVPRAIDAIERAGLLRSRTRRRSPAGDYTSTIYELVAIGGG
jgi:DNA-binding MarR family transcriptional regulator